MFWKILLALFFFGFMIMSHEFGHFITARLFRVGVNEFAIGMGPKLFSKTSKKSGTAYSLRALPIGGFVSLVGEDTAEDREDSLSKKPWWQRFIILFAGSFMNVLLAVSVMFIALSMEPYYASTRIDTAYIENSVLCEYDVQNGDKIVEIEGESMKVWRDIYYKISLDGTKPLDITVERNGERIVFEDVQFKTEEVEGILCGTVDFYLQPDKKTVGTLLREAVFQSFSTVKMIISTLVDLITGRFGLEAVSGPIGTVKVIADSASMGLDSLLYLFSLISMNLGVFNLLPFPALDGGRIFFVLIEALRGKPIQPKYEGIVHAVGMVILLAFMAVVVVSDVIKLL